VAFNEARTHVFDAATGGRIGTAEVLGARERPG
jgi:hypothetical protein